MRARQVMQYPGPPRVGADRSSSDQDGLLASGVLGRRLESPPSPALLSELDCGQHERFRDDSPESPHYYASSPYGVVRPHHLGVFVTLRAGVISLPER